MENLLELLINLKNAGCSGIKVSFEDEGALLNEITTMRYLTAKAGLELSIKIGGCEAKRDIVECIHLGTDAIVAPMVESSFSLKKFLDSIKSYKYTEKKGFNLETVESYNNLNDLSKDFDKLDFVTFGRVDFVGSLNKDRNFVNSDEIYDMVHKTFTKVKETGTKCYMGGAITIDSKDFIKKLIDEKLLDKFETRYIIYDVSKINFNDFEKLLHLGNIFEVEWLKFIRDRYNQLSSKDSNRIKMMEERLYKNFQK